MKRLSKDQENQKTDLLKKLSDAKSEVDAALSEVNTAITDKLNAKIGAYNDALGEIASFRDDLVGEMESYADERSDKWREGDAGSAYEEWKGEWENVDLEELEEASELEDVSMDHGENVEALPSQPEG